MNNTKKILCTIGVILFSMILLIPAAVTLYMSFADYHISSGLLGSSIVGFRNFSAVINSAYFLSLFKNTLFISLAGTVIGCIYVFISSIAVGSSKNSFLKAILTLLFMLPALIPVNILLTLFPGGSSPELLRLCVSFADGLRIAAFTVMASFFIEDDAFRGGIKCLLLFVSVRLIYFFTTDLAVVLGVYSPNNYETLDVFSSYVYRNSLMNGDFSSTAALHVIKTVLQILPAMLGCVILAKIMKGQTSVSQKSCKGAVVFGIIPFALLLCVVATGGSLLPVVFDKTVIFGYINEFLIALISALSVTLFAAVLAFLAKNSGVAGIIAVALLCVTGNCIPSEYVIMRSLGLLRTIFGVVFKNFGMISLLALVFTFILSQCKSVPKSVAAFIAGFAAVFAGFWGNSVSPQIVLTDRAAYPLSLVLREISLSPVTYDNVLFSTVPYILIPIAVACLGLAVCAVISKIKE